jgi:signal transduction histidine kinase/DNA-binding response OmpR family regulator
VTGQVIKVLLVEDNREMALTMEEMLQEVTQRRRPTGTAPLVPVFQVQWAASLAEALEQLGQNGIDVVLLDLSLPDSQDLETFARAHASAPQVPMIVLTEIDDESLAIGAVRAGAQDYLVKGHVDGNLLARSIRYAIERQRVEEVIRQRNQELILLNRASQSLISSLEQVLITFLEEVRRLLDVDISSAWLLDASTGELVCQQATGPRSEVVRGRKLAPGQGLAGWVVQTGQSLVVPDASADERHAGLIDAQAGWSLRSILSVPLRTQTKVIGVLQAMDNRPQRFEPTDVTLLELLAPTAAVAIANAQLYRQARQDAAEVEARNEELDAFAHTVAHDLKNPLTTILTFASLVEEDCAGGSPGESTQRYAQMISQNARKMQSIVEELLLLAGVRRTEVVAMAPLDMNSIVREALQRLGPMIDEWQAQVLAPASWPLALGYAPWMEEIWVNYVSNAIKYGGRPPRVELGAKRLDNGMLLFGVHDNGRGLNPEDQSRLFTPFTRLDQVSTQGHGLGLSIVRRIVEKMGGQVGVESVPGQGSTFFLTLPAASVEP